MGRLRAVWARTERALRGPIETSAPAVRCDERARVGRDGSRSPVDCTSILVRSPQDKFLQFPKELNTCESAPPESD